MKKLFLISTCCLIFTGSCFLTTCTEKHGEESTLNAGFALADLVQTQGSQETERQKQVALGEHLVLIAGCHDCHTPKKMTPKGPEIDFSLALSGHPANAPAPEIDRLEVERKGLVVTQTLTAWVGPWGVSYAANLTPDKTGTGSWQEENFINAIREGKLKGVGRPLLPPMPWDMYRNMTDEELKAIFAYLRTIKPINNVVPAPQPPVTQTKAK